MAVSNRGMTTTDNIDLNEILYGKIIPAVDTYNEEEVLDLRALTCTDWDESYRKFAASSRWKFDELAEGEWPVGRKIIWGKRQKDTRKFGLGIQYTEDWLASNDASSAEIARMTAEAMDRDRSLQTTIILDIMSTTSTDGFFNGAFSTGENMTLPQSYGNNTFAATHTHYVASGSTTLALSDITAAKDHLKEHGYKQNIWGICNSDFTKKVEDLAGWAALSSTATIVVTPVVDDISINGFRGRMLGIDWLETEWLPDDYFLLIGTGTGQNKPVNFIQKANEAYRGLLLRKGANPDYPIIGSAYIRWLSAQVLLRGAGVIYYLASAWTDPSITSNTVT